jgi:hypothetical protein
MNTLSNGFSHSICETAEPPFVSVLPGIFQPSSLPGKALAHPRVQPQLDGNSILEAALRGASPESVRKHHTNIYNCDPVISRNEPLLQRIRQNLNESIAGGEARVRELGNLLQQVLPTSIAGTPAWSAWTIAELTALLLFSVALLVADLNASASILMNGGLDTFRGHYFRAAFFNLSLICGGAFLCKAMSRLFETDAARRRYLFAVGILAAIAVTYALPVWASMYAKIQLDPLSQLAGPETNSGPTALPFVAQIAAGNLLAGFLWLASSRLIDPHIRDKRDCSALRKEAERITARLHSERRKLGIVEGRLAGIEADRNKFVERALEKFQLAQSIATSR